MWLAKSSLIGILIAFLSNFPVLANESRTLSIGLQRFPGHLDPIRYSRLSYLLIIKSLHRGLVKTSPTRRVASDLADTWEIRDDFKTFVFCLGEARLHNSQPIRAQDIQFTFDRLKSKSSGSSMAEDFAKMDPIVKEIPGGRCVSIHLKLRIANFLDILAGPAASIVSAASKDPDFPIGAGDYRLKAVDLQNKTFAMEALEPEKTSGFATINFQEIPDESEAERLLKLHTIDAYFGWQNYKRLGALQKIFSISALPAFGYVHLFFNKTAPGMDDPNFRNDLALELGDVIRKASSGNHFLKPMSHLIPMGILPPDYYQDREEESLSRLDFIQKWKGKWTGKNLRVVLFLNELTEDAQAQVTGLFHEMGARVSYEFNPETYGSRLAKRDYDMISAERHHSFGGALPYYKLSIIRASIP